MNQRIGKAMIDIHVRGCIECGTHWSRYWMIARNVSVRIGSKEDTIAVHICADCYEKQNVNTPSQIENQN